VFFIILILISAILLFQAKIGHDKEFEEALQTLRGKDCDVSIEAAEIRVLIK